MNQAKVKARKVGDSVVMTLPKVMLDSTGFLEGDSLLLESNVPGFLSVRKENDKMEKLKEAEMELTVLRRKLDFVNSEVELAGTEYKHSMPTRHPGIEDPTMMEAYMNEFSFRQSKIRLKIAKKELAIYRMSGLKPQQDRVDS